MILTRSLSTRVLRSSVKGQPKKSRSQVRWSLRRASLREQRLRVSPSDRLSCVLAPATISPFPLSTLPFQSPSRRRSSPGNAAPNAHEIHDWMDPPDVSDDGSLDSMLSSDSSADALFGNQINFGAPASDNA